MSIIEAVVRLFAPHTCLDCGAEEDRLLCAGCVRGVVTIPSRCYRCQNSTDGYRTCSSCTKDSSLHQVVVRTHYRGSAKTLVRRLKFDRAQAAAQEMADLLAPLLVRLPSNVVLVHIPTASSRVRSRGYDHARLLVRRLGSRSGLPRQILLARSGQARQVGAGRAVRTSQLEHAFRSVRPELIRGRHIVLVDDVLTTGATLEAAARVLLNAGAARVSAAVFAQA